ncbi:MAG: putative nucleotide-diphospho-sugar transferase [Patescibacteria group bacterium]
MRDELKKIAKAFFYYHRGFPYLYWRFIAAPRIYRAGVLEKPATRDDLSVHMLFGARDMLLACWSLASWYSVSTVHGRLFIHSDGTLTDAHKVTLKRLFPSHTCVDARDVVDEHGAFFEAHPALKKFRTRYKKFQAKKLLDPYLSSNARYRLVLDSDMLWFKNPVELWDALDAGLPRTLMMDDGAGPHSYVVFKNGSRLSEELAQFNSGVTFYRSDQFSVEKLTAYIHSIDWEHAKFTDQAAYATMFMPTVERLPMSRYIIKGTLTDDIIMRHYTNPSRTKFYFYGLDRVYSKIFSNHV